MTPGEIDGVDYDDLLDGDATILDIEGCDVL